MLSANLNFFLIITFFYSLWFKAAFSTWYIFTQFEVAWHRIADTITCFLRVKALQDLCFSGSTYYVSGSKDTVYYGTAEGSDDTKADEDDRCNQLREENKTRYHLPLHNQAISALSTRICRAQSISPQAISDPNVCPGCTDSSGWRQWDVPLLWQSGRSRSIVPGWVSGDLIE